MKTLSMIFFFSMLCLNCGFKEIETAFETKEKEFIGKMMISDDQGKTWREVKAIKGLDIISFASDGKDLMLGSKKAVLSHLDVQSSEVTASEDIMKSQLNHKTLDENHVSCIYSGRSGKYAYVYGAGIFRKKNGDTYWKPLNTPEGIYHVNHFAEDKAGNILFANHYGVYRSKDQGQSWDRIFKFGFAENIILLDDKMIVNGVNGINVSTDDGNNWTQMEGLKPHCKGQYDVQATGLFYHRKTLYWLKKATRSMYDPNSGSQFLYSEDAGNTWQTHPAQKYLEAQTDILSLHFEGNKIFFSSKNALYKTDQTGSIYEKVFQEADSKESSSFLLKSVSNKLVCLKLDIGC